MTDRYEVIIVGGGVTGTALFYMLSHFSNVSKMLLLEKNPDVAMVNSHPLNNAQTSHDGGTETNLSLKHALEVQGGATMLRRYVRGQANCPGLFKVTNRMVLGVGAWEVAQLEARFKEFRPYYPDLRLVYAEELWRIEPKVMEGRNPNEPVAALVSKEGYAVDYQKLSQCFLRDAQLTPKRVDVRFSTSLTRVERLGGNYVLHTSEGVFTAPVVVFAAGAYSLLFAQDMGYGRDLAILPVEGDFFSGGELLKGKVYRVQIEGMPFAAIHGDPDVLNQKDTRFGPTTRPMPLMEAHHYKTFFDFRKLPLISSFAGLRSLMRISSDRRLLWYVIKNIAYSLPLVGKYLFLKEARVIVPTIRYRDLKPRRGVGGIRPQIVDMKTGTLQMGDSSIVGDNVIFNTTPSPGASICLSNAKRDAQRVVDFLGDRYSFDKDAVERDLGSPQLV